MEILLPIISIVSSVLSIILFFKVWKMTNDVNSISEFVYSIACIQEELSNKQKESKMDNTKLFATINADKNNADVILRTLIVNEFIAIIKTVEKQVEENIKINYNGEYITPNAYVEIQYKSVKDKYSKFYKAIGKELPQDIASLSADSYMSVIK